MKKEKGNKRYRFPFIKYVSPGDVVYGTGSIVNNILTTAP